MNHSSAFVMGGNSPSASSLAALLLSDAAPMSEARNPTPGAAQKATREGHQHPRLSSVTNQPSGANGDTTVMFTRTFDKEPFVLGNIRESVPLGPVTFIVKRFLRPDGVTTWVAGQGFDIAGAVVYAYRERKLPANNTATLVVAGLVIAAQLSAQFGALNNYEPWVPLEAGVPTTITALASSQ